LSELHISSAWFVLFGNKGGFGAVGQGSTGIVSRVAALEANYSKADEILQV